LLGFKTLHDSRRCTKSPLKGPPLGPNSQVRLLHEQTLIATNALNKRWWSRPWSLQNLTTLRDTAWRW
jgi:hypothetical protein